MTKLVDVRLAAVALVAAILLWGFSQSTATQERGFDIPVVAANIPDDLILTSRSSDAVDIRVRGSRGALRRVPTDLEYTVDLTDAKPGVTSLEVDLTALEVGRGAQIVSRSPTQLEFTLERKISRRMRVKPDVVGVPAEGFVLGTVEALPRRVLIAGAESEVLRLGEVLTETIDVTGATATIERPVGAVALGQHAWLEPDQEIRVRAEILPEPPPEPERNARRGGR
ncbi:MAG TPA: CdaR family protein [Myxococcota bacterium]|nr:CdaR family protein [Myxococcota bacterium]